jgi:hypothetical protein
VRPAMLLLVVAVGVSGATHPLSCGAALAEVAQPAEAAFRSAMEAWAYDAYWRLWDMGTASSRKAISQQEFTDRMRRGNAVLESGGQIEAITVSSHSAQVVILEARFVLRHLRRGWREVVQRPFLLMFEDEAWRVNLWDFVGLVSYFPPDVLPTPPAPVPQSRRP